MLKYISLVTPTRFLAFPEGEYAWYEQDQNVTITGDHI